MTIDIRALGFLLFLMAAGVIVYAMTAPQGGSGERVDPSGIFGHDDPERFPWKLVELYRPYLGWRTVGYYPSKSICLEAKRREERKTGNKHDCRER